MSTSERIPSLNVINSKGLSLVNKTAENSNFVYSKDPGIPNLHEHEVFQNTSASEGIPN